MKKLASLLAACTLVSALAALSSCGGNGSPASGGDGAIVIGHEGPAGGLPSAAEVAAAKAILHIFYAHTSHGSQLITGMDCLAAYPGYSAGLYAYAAGGGAGALDLRDYYGGVEPPDLSQGDVVGASGDTTWAEATRTYLAGNPEINVVVWSWCSIAGHDAERYVDSMEKLISEYPEVVFVFMTGHAEGQGEDDSVDGVHYNNQLIRSHCASRGRVLFDFADVEAYDPDGVYYWDRSMADNLDYLDGSTARNWAVDWIAANPDAELTKLTMGTSEYPSYGGCADTAHSEDPPEANLNGILKGRAAWRLWAALAPLVD